MSTTRTPKCRAKGGAQNCTKANCPEKIAAMGAFFNDASAGAKQAVAAVEVAIPVNRIAVRQLLTEEFAGAMSVHEDFGMFPYIDVDYAVERFRAQMIPPHTEDYNDKAAVKALSNYIWQAKQTYEKRWNPSQFESPAAYEAYAANPVAAPYVDLDLVIADLAEVLDRPEDTSEWEIL